MSSEEFQRLLASISKIAGGAAVRRYVENVGKIVTVSLSPYALEMVSYFSYGLALYYCCTTNCWDNAR